MRLPVQKGAAQSHIRLPLSPVSDRARLDRVPPLVQEGLPGLHQRSPRPYRGRPVLLRAAPREEPRRKNPAYRRLRLFTALHHLNQRNLETHNKSIEKEGLQNGRRRLE